MTFKRCEFCKKVNVPDNAEPIFTLERKHLICECCHLEFKKVQKRILSNTQTKKQENKDV